MFLSNLCHSPVGSALETNAIAGVWPVKARKTTIKSINKYFEEKQGASLRKFSNVFCACVQMLCGKLKLVRPVTQVSKT